MARQHEVGHSLSVAGVLVALGIIFGDIGTSPLYALKAIVGGHVVDEQLVLGAISCIFWTLTLITTVKYVRLALNIDNKGEGGIFSLYALVRRKRKNWMIFIAIIGCSTLMADGFLTPSISISSAIEGLDVLYPGIQTMPIVIVILIVLFSFQQFGTNVVGRTFGPIMMLWFGMMAFFGVKYIIEYPSVLAALNPYYGISLLLLYPKGFLLLGGVFLCTTGAEALYSDLGHCGKHNIRISWVFVKICLVLSYFGQGAFLLHENSGNVWNPDVSIFYAMISKSFLPFAIVIAAMAAIIASQALISGSFTLINEAMKLRLMPNLKVNYPTQMMGQIYIPFVNWMLLAGCITVVLIFRESTNMEAAYGLAITLDMLMTTTLMAMFYRKRNNNKFFIGAFILTYFTIEIIFFWSNAHKFLHGGWFSFMIAGFFFIVMFVLMKARALRDKHTEFTAIVDIKDKLNALQGDDTIAREATNLVFMSTSSQRGMLDSNIVYSIFRKKPKRADVYWFVHMEIVNDPFERNYSVDTIIPGTAFFVTIRFGFKVEHKINLVLNHIYEQMVQDGEVDGITRYPSLRKYKIPADFKFYLINSRVSVDDKISPLDQLIIRLYRLVKSVSLPPEKDFGLELTNVSVETVPINISRKASEQLKGLYRV